MQEQQRWWGWGTGGLSPYLSKGDGRTHNFGSFVASHIEIMSCCTNCVMMQQVKIMVSWNKWKPETVHLCISSLKELIILNSALKNVSLLLEKAMLMEKKWMSCW